MLLIVRLYISILSIHVFLLLQINRSGDNNTSSKTNSSSTDNANTSTEDSNASAGNTTTNSSDGAVKFVEAPLPKVNAWKVSHNLFYIHIKVFFLFDLFFVHFFKIQHIVQLSKKIAFLNISSNLFRLH